VQGRGGEGMSTGKREEKGRRERGEGRKKEGKRGEKWGGKGILVIPILVCFRRRCSSPMFSSTCSLALCSSPVSVTVRSPP